MALLLETREANLSRAMRQLNGVYTQGFNRRHSQVGHVLQGRFKAILVDRDAYLLELCRYVVLNPVRAKITRKPDSCNWSSYRATAGRAAVAPFLAVEWVLAQFSKQRAAAQRKYERFVAEGMGQASPWEQLQGQVLLGAETLSSVCARRFRTSGQTARFRVASALRRARGWPSCSALAC